MSDNKQYISIYGAEGYITAPQYIAELIISRQSKFLKQTLPPKFWLNDKYIDWRKKYLNQIRRANAINKSGFSFEIILKALNSYNGKWICSLFNKKLDFLLTEADRKQEIVEIKEKVEPDKPLLETSDVNSSRESRVDKSKATKLSKLRD